MSYSFIFEPLSEVDGLGGSRTRVQKFIPCPSTIIVNLCGILHPCSLIAQEIDNQGYSVAS